ncbi:hypothetical protein, partial [Klebsiella variicola]|uniref:hypothetical protein n=1 Tax=Klebsiella variicola TaxID=244366 RepID=UPI002731487D
MADGFSYARQPGLGGNSGGGGQLSPFMPLSAAQRHSRPTVAQPRSPQPSTAMSWAIPTASPRTASG